MEATAVGDGTYSIAGMTCIVKDGKAMTTDGHLAGSTLSLLDGLVNLMRFCGLSLDEALPTATRNPAEMVRVSDKVGTLEVGKQADFVVLSPDFHEKEHPTREIRMVVLGGKAV
jgi:N-acetylglucosamine-6-phosphate deacetylase